jgi:hypothetical protein
MYLVVTTLEHPALAAEGAEPHLAALDAWQRAYWKNDFTPVNSFEGGFGVVFRSYKRVAVGRVSEYFAYSSGYRSKSPTLCIVGSREVVEVP